MNDREILTAAMRCRTAYENRLTHVTEHNQFKFGQRRLQRPEGSVCELGGRVTAAKRVELAALRKLAKACQAVRAAQELVAEADVIDVPFRMAYVSSKGELN